MKANSVVAINTAISTREETEARGISWRDVEAAARETARAILAVCRAAAPLARAAAVTLWQIVRLVIFASVTLAHAARVYGPGFAAAIGTGARTIAYRGRALCFRCCRTYRMARWAARRAAGIALEHLGRGLHLMAGVAVLVALVATKAAAILWGIAQAAAGCIRSGWDLREEIIRESKEA